MYPFRPSSESESNYPIEYPGSATEQQNIGQGGLGHDQGSQAYYSHHGHETQGLGNQQVSGQQQNTQAQVIPVHDSEGSNEGYQAYYPQYGHETQDLGMQQMSGQQQNTQAVIPSQGSQSEGYQAYYSQYDQGTQAFGTQETSGWQQSTLIPDQGGSHEVYSQHGHGTHGFVTQEISGWQQSTLIPGQGGSNEGYQAHYSQHDHEIQGTGNQQLSGQAIISSQESQNEGYQAYYSQHGHEIQGFGIQDMFGWQQNSVNSSQRAYQDFVGHYSPIPDSDSNIFLENAQNQPSQFKPPLSQENLLYSTLPMEANALEHPTSSTSTVLPANSNIYLQLVQDIMQYEWRYPGQSNIPRPVSPRPVVSSSTIKRLQTNTSHPINIVLSEFLISESTKNLLWTELESIYQDNPHSSCLQEIQDSVPVALTTFFESFFVFPSTITSNQLKKELSSSIYPELEVRLLTSTFCGSQEIPTPLSDISIARRCAINILKNLLQSRIQDINQSPNNDTFFLLLDKPSRDVIEWWRKTGAFSQLPAIYTNRSNKQELVLVKALDLESICFCHSEMNGEVHFFANSLIYHGLVEFYGQKPLQLGIKHLSVLNNGQIPMCMVAFVITGAIFSHYREISKHSLQFSGAGVLQNLYLPVLQLLQRAHKALTTSSFGCSTQYV
ncbi:hypothetical protein EV363DRAFT_1462956 [Boletus edulis]|nr:hypothetical protein EV363DRAFT_1462956 [Boletus edulis]